MVILRVSRIRRGSQGFYATVQSFLPNNNTMKSLKWRNPKWNSLHYLCYIGIGTYNVLLSWGGWLQNWLETWIWLHFHGTLSAEPSPSSNCPLDSRNALTLTSHFTGVSCALAYFTLSGVRLCYEFNNEYGVRVFSSFLLSNALLGGYLII